MICEYMIYNIYEMLALQIEQNYHQLANICSVISAEYIFPMYTT